MKVTVDLSGLDEFVEEVDENATELMKEAAQRSRLYAEGTQC